MRLSLWLAAKDISVPEFAAQIKVSRQALYRYMDGTRYPERDVRAAIFVATGGDVTSNDFDPDLKPLARAS